MNIHLNYLAIFIATILQIVLGMVWFGPNMFGKLWAKILETDIEKMSETEKKKIQAAMGGLYFGQAVMTLISIIVLSVLLKLSVLPPYTTTLLLWLGFILPSMATATIWSKTKPKYMAVQIAVSTLYQLVSMLVTTAIISYF